MNEGEKKPAWYYEPWVVLVLLFLVLGPFGLPFLYKSPRFSRPAKLFLTLVTGLYTVYLVWATFKVMQEVLARFPLLQP